MLDESFIATIPDDLVEGSLFIIREYNDYIESFTNSPVPPSFQEYFEYWSLMRSFLKKHNYPYDEIDIKESEYEINNQIINRFANFGGEFHKLANLDFIDKTTNKFDALFKNTFSYEFTDGDLERIQQLINELRDQVAKSEHFTADHQQRILKRLEKLQSELHKRVSDLDKFWGLIGDAGVVIGKFGTDAKPFVDRIREIADIVWRTQSKAEELESGFKIPLLTDFNDSE